MNLQVTELKIGNVQAANIEWNGAEIKASLDKALEDYRNMVVTEETLKGSKKVMAELNKQAKAIDDFRKATVKQLNPSIKQFETESKELVSMIKEARTVINDQVETFIIRQREEKRELVKCAINSVSHEIELKEKYLARVELKEQYLNSSMTINKVTEDLRIQFNTLLQEQQLEQNKIDTIKVIVDTYNDKLTFKFDPNEFDYLLDNDIAYISSVVNEKVQGRLAEQEAELARIKAEEERKIKEAEERARLEAERKAKEEADRIEREHQEALRQKEIEKQRAIEAEQAELRRKEFEAMEQQRKLQEQQAKILEQVSKQVEDITPVENEKSRKRKVKLEIRATKEQMNALKNYMDQYDIEYTKL